jgi:hypothetical protein
MLRFTLEVISVVLVLLWLLGWMVVPMGDLDSLLLVIILVVLIRLPQGRPPGAGAPARVVPSDSMWPSRSALTTASPSRSGETSGCEVGLPFIGVLPGENGTGVR